MAKTKTPFLSMGASGTIGSQLTTQKRGQLTLLREKPIPTYRNTLPQQYQRWLYQDYAYLWTQLSAADKQTWQTAASRYHRTGFAHFMSDRLSTLPDIVGWWRLDEKIGATASDSSKNGNDGTIFGATPSPATINGGYSFDGIDDYILIPHNTSLNTDYGTFETFFTRTPDLGQWHILFAKQTGHISAAFSIRTNPAANINWNCFLSSAGRKEAWSGTLPPFQQTHFAMTFNGTLIRGFLQGLEQFSTAVAADTLLTNTLPLYLGAQAVGALPCAGPLDNFIFYNRALDATEILRHSLRRYP